MDGDSFTSVSEYLYGKVLETEEIEVFLNALAHVAVHELSTEPERMLCGITLVRRKRAGTVASSSPEAQELDEIQYDLRNGPCLAAARNHVVVQVPDLHVDDRWPGYAEQVLPHGIRSILAVPFELGDGDAAALNLYSTLPSAFGPQEIQTAQDYAARASGALALAVKLAKHREQAADLLEALKTRTTIDLAVGIIMGQNRCSQEDAFGILRSASNSRNIKLRDVAAGVIGSTGTQTPSTHFET